MMTKDFGIGFLERHLFNKEVCKQFQDSVSVEDIEALCEQWWMKSSEEKQMFVGKLNMSFKRKTSQNGVTDFGLTECNYI